jgi:hypothetical protein
VNIPFFFFPPNETRRASQFTQQSITLFAQPTKKPTAAIPVTKAGIQEHVLAIVATCDLVCILKFLFRPAELLSALSIH